MTRPGCICDSVHLWRAIAIVLVKAALVAALVVVIVIVITVAAVVAAVVAGQPPRSYLDLELELE